MIAVKILAEKSGVNYFFYYLFTSIEVFEEMKKMRKGSHLRLVGNIISHSQVSPDYLQKKRTVNNIFLKNNGFFFTGKEEA
ncbi:MAG: hypothetical protein K9M44_01600 [Candidatus Pacebacteria bacterium]|nr:hypothetical protein [Candidatus Paceibacterota bacterium]